MVGTFWTNEKNQTHRDGGLPAIICELGKFYYKNDLQHRDGDLPAVESANGDLRWCVNGNTHRDGDKPAVITKKTKQWYVNGVLHRTTGPAIINASGAEFYYINGKSYSYEEFKEAVKLI